MATYEITIKGTVQGVFFRQSTRQKALELGLTGFVENREDDTVFIRVSGEQNLIDELVRWCHLGPPKAIVEKVNVSKIDTEKFETFTIRRY